MLIEELYKRKKELEQLIDICKEKQKDFPEGTLRISVDKKRVQYYHRSTLDTGLGKYIKKKNISLAHALADKDYYTKVLESAQKELISIVRTINVVHKQRPEIVYDSLSEERQKLVTPLILDDKTYIEKWRSNIKEGRPFKADDPVFVTDRRERVRSKSELIIANTYAKLGIPYKYENPVCLDGGILIYTDFTALKIKTREEIYHEHFGMMDNPEYLRNFFRKQSTYIKNGIIPGKNYIATFESKNNPLNNNELENYLKAIFF